MWRFTAAAPSRERFFFRLAFWYTFFTSLERFPGINQRDSQTKDTFFLPADSDTIFFLMCGVVKTLRCCFEIIGK